MHPKQIFYLAVRLLGLVFVYLGLIRLPGIVSASDLRPMMLALITGTFFLGCAWWLLVGGPLPALFGRKDLTDLAFPDDPN